MHKLHRLTSWFCITALLFLLSGCAERPFLTKDGVYSFITISERNNIQKTPISLAWNSNYAVMQQLLLEASFVLGDLHTISDLPERDAIVFNEVDQELEKDSPELALLLAPTDLINPSKSKGKEAIQEVLSDEPKGLLEESQMGKELLSKAADTVLLEAAFPEAKSFELMIDDRSTNLEITSIQIEVIGDHPGRVILNQTIILQGIENPNLEPAFAQFMEMLKKYKNKQEAP